MRLRAWLPYLLLLPAAVAVLVEADRFPEVMPVHWGANLVPNGFVTKSTLALLAPLIFLAGLLLLLDLIVALGSRTGPPPVTAAVRRLLEPIRWVVALSGFPAAERIEQLAVLLHCLLPPRLAEAIGEEARPLHPRVQLRVVSEEHRIPRSLHQPAVNGLVEGEVRRELTPVVVRLHLVVEGLDLGDLRLAHPDAGQLSRQRLQRRQDLEHRPQIGLGELRHPGPAIGEQLDQPLGGEDLQCLPERGSGDAQLPADDPLVDPVAPRELALDDQRPEPAQDIVVQRRRAGGALPGSLAYGTAQGQAPASAPAV